MTYEYIVSRDIYTGIPTAMKRIYTEMAGDGDERATGTWSELWSATTVQGIGLDGTWGIVGLVFEKRAFPVFQEEPQSVGDT